MKNLAYTFHTNIVFDQDVTDHYFTLRCLPRPTPWQNIITQSLTLSPETPWTLQRDGFGNLLEVGCCRGPHREFGFVVSGQADVETSIPRTDGCNPIFGYESPLTRLGPGLRELYQLHAENLSPEDMMHLVHETLSYTPGVTGIRTTAEEALALGKGVCQDEAHILIALLRMAGWPARYVCGLFVGEGATHAWVEYYQDGYWYGLDPTRDRLTGEDYLVISYGRDYSDCPVERGVFRGNTGQLQTVFMQVQER